MTWPGFKPPTSQTQNRHSNHYITEYGPTAAHCTTLMAWKIVNEIVPEVPCEHKQPFSVPLTNYHFLFCHSCFVKTKTVKLLIAMSSHLINLTQVARII